MKQNFLNDLSEIIPKFSKLILFATLGFCIFCFFIFTISYVRLNQFFSFDLLSFDHLWIFIFLFIYLLVFAFLALPFNIVIHYIIFKKKKSDFLFYCSILSILFFVVFLIFILTSYHYEAKWLLFCGVIAFVYFVFLGAFFYYYERKNLKNSLSIIFMNFIFISYLAILFPQYFEKGFKFFLNSKGLSAQRVEIYLKDKQKFLIGELLFRDSQFAYVRFVDNIQGLGEKNITKLVPNENISIFKDSPTNP